MANDVLGYRTHGGAGITNQKLGFIGLLLHAYENKRPVVLPHFRVMDQIARLHRMMEFEEVFELEPIEAVCAAHGIEIVSTKLDDLPEGYDPHFWKAHSVTHNVHQRADHPETTLLYDILAALRPRVRGSFIARALREETTRQYPGFTVCQFRIEKDWKEHCESNLNARLSSDEENYCEFESILAKIKITLPDVSAVYAVCDEKSLLLPKEHLKAIAKDYYGIALFFKSDYISQFEYGVLTELHLSLLDFEFASFADRFVGLTRSTFSSLATLEKFSRERQNVQGHYIYNLKGSRLFERTDNGCTWDPKDAIRWAQGLV